MSMSISPLWHKVSCLGRMYILLIHILSCFKILCGDTYIYATLKGSLDLPINITGWGPDDRNAPCLPVDNDYCFGDDRPFL